MKKLKKNLNTNFRKKEAAIAVLLIIVLTLSTFSAFIPVSNAADSGWTLTQDGQSMKAYADLKEYVYQKSAAMAPNGPYDKIGLHRLVKDGVTPKAVVFMIPGLYGSGERLVSNPETDSYEMTEETSQCIYWANRGFDVYTLDFRSHFIPENLNKSQLNFTLSWGMQQYISDIKEAVDKAKVLSGAEKVFMSGMSWGGVLAQVYASKYWQQDLRGLILLDPGPMKSTIAKNQNQTNTLNLTNTLNGARLSGSWTWENPQQSSTPSPFGTGYVFLVKFAAANPGAPAQYPNGTLVTTVNPRTGQVWANITEFLEYQWNANKMYNTYGGYSDINLLINNAASADRYYPLRVFMEWNVMLDWTVCPFVEYDFLAHIREINVPVIGFRSGLNAAAYGEIVNGMATSDFTTIMVPNYGHGDIFQGTYCGRDVSEPALQWMLSHMTVQEKGDLQGAYRNWSVMLYENRIYVFPPSTLANAPTIMSVGTWDQQYYSRLGITPLDAAKPAIDDLMSNPYLR